MKYITIRLQNIVIVKELKNIIIININIKIVLTILKISVLIIKITIFTNNIIKMERIQRNLHIHNNHSYHLLQIKRTNY